MALVMVLQNTRQHIFQNPRGKGGKGRQNHLKCSTAGAVAATTHQEASGLDDTFAVFRATAMRKAAAQLRSDAALASATPPIAWQKPRCGEQPLERDLPLPLHKSAKEEARAQARKPQLNNQWLTPFGSSNAPGSPALSFQPDGQALPEHFAVSEHEQEEDEFAQLDYSSLIAKQAQNNKFIGVAAPGSEEHLAFVATAKK